MITKYKGIKKNLSIKELLNSLKSKNEDIIVDVFPIKTQYKKNNNKTEEIDYKKKIIVIAYLICVKFADKESLKKYLDYLKLIIILVLNV